MTASSKVRPSAARGRNEDRPTAVLGNRSCARWSERGETVAQSVGLDEGGRGRLAAHCGHTAAFSRVQECFEMRPSLGVAVEMHGSHVNTSTARASKMPSVVKCAKHATHLRRRLGGRPNFGSPMSDLRSGLASGCAAATRPPTMPLPVVNDGADGMPVRGGHQPADHPDGQWVGARLDAVFTAKSVHRHP